MSWWGKLVGGTFGFMMGGPIGALLGAVLGNYFDGGLDSISMDETLGIGATERVQSVFFTTTFAVMGYVAKSDGQVTRDEIALAEQVMQQMQLNAEQRKLAIRLFDEGKKDGFPVQEILAQFKQESHRRRNLVQMFLEIVIATALADGELNVREQDILESLASDLGWSTDDFQQLLSMVSGQAQFGEQQTAQEKLAAAYELLGIDASVNDQALKKAYRRLMNQHHPDKLVAKGLPEEMIDIATQKTQDIKSAYELIKSHRA
ncbi:MAG TPA: co-chaperone DjlA [Gammaproteobacteria bacterium]|nr:co-chaperone DjlA [Gammaproteobacteria bacterium]HBQ00362.1 co-chaperone DjlA [Gammaproteobacteria bacterium]